MAVGKSVNITPNLAQLPLNIKYNCVVLFLIHLYLLFIYASKYYKTSSQNLVPFPQGVDEEQL